MIFHTRTDQGERSTARHHALPHRHRHSEARAVDEGEGALQGRHEGPGEHQLHHHLPGAEGSIAQLLHLLRGVPNKGKLSDGAQGLSDGTSV